MHLWGPTDRPETLKLSIPMRFADHPDSLRLVQDTMAALTGWRTCFLVTAAPSALKMTGKLFPDRHSSGFAIWLPDLIPLDVDLSESHDVRPLADGIFISTQPAIFNLANSAALKTVHRVDGHLMEAGLLPSLAQFPHPL